MDDITKMAAQYGVPLALLVWFLWRIEPAMGALTRAVNRQSTIFLLLVDRLQFRCTYLAEAVTSEQEEQLRRIKAEIEEGKEH